MEKPESDAVINALHELMMAQRAALLQQVDAIEVFLGIERTSEIRKQHKNYFTEENTSYSV